MAIRLVITITAASGKGADLVAAYRERCALVVQEPGCEQFEVFQSVVDPNRLVLLEHWTEQAALDAHLEMNQTRSPIPREWHAGPASAKTTNTTEYANKR
jgi:quinol monooxygenase YgiN